MKAREKTFGKDAILFYEGDAADCVYVVLSGRVELSKQSGESRVPLALVGPQEMFGEMGPFDDSPRNATARALEKTRVKIIPRQQFRAWIAGDPDAALRIIATLVDRLRAADEMIARLGGVALAGVTGSVSLNPHAFSATQTQAEAKRPGLVDAVISLLRRRRDGGSGQDGPVPSFQIGLCTVNNDVDGAWTRALAGLIEGRQGLAVRILSYSLNGDYNADQAAASAAVLRARQVLAREETLDLVVWGDVHQDGYSLWFHPAGPTDEDRPGAFGPFTTLELAGHLEPPVAEMFHAAVLAALEPLTEGQRVLQRLCLPGALQGLPPFPDDLPVSWTQEQQRTGLLCYGHAIASMAGWEGDADLYDRAAEIYRAALNRLPPDMAHGVHEATLRKHLAAAAMAAGDKRQNTDYLAYAVDEYRTAVECLFKGTYPLEWASAQNRLGLALYKLDLLTGQPELLKEALAALQAALTVFNRVEQPQRWADVMNNLAQVLQIYGDQMKSPDVLERAVDACRAALEFRSRDRTPLAFAASQNSLGTALFLLDKHKRSDQHREQAREAFSTALEVYRALGATRQAAVAVKNLSHLQKLDKAVVEPGPKAVEPGWLDQE
ncbi:cAMP receptor protein [mine drainage metagenome]|uniref:cAMP receptor protein n=1 Tax=mine drainage metagenome TaxID=410659 RepID=A0A1J5T817_9ZZZZ